MRPFYSFLPGMVNWLVFSRKQNINKGLPKASEWLIY